MVCDKHKASDDGNAKKCHAISTETKVDIDCY